jgi:hypothetical protein
LKTLLQYLKKAVNKYGISAPGYIYVFIEFWWAKARSLHKLRSVSVTELYIWLCGG